MESVSEILDYTYSVTINGGELFFKIEYESPKEIYKEYFSLERLQQISELFLGNLDNGKKN